MIPQLLKNIPKSVWSNTPVTIVYQLGDYLREVEGHIIAVDENNQWIELQKFYGNTICIHQDCLLTYEHATVGLDENRITATGVSVSLIDEEKLSLFVAQYKQSLPEAQIKSVEALDIKVPYYNRLKHLDDDDLREFSQLCNQIKSKYQNALKSKNKEKLAECLRILQRNEWSSYFGEYKYNWVSIYQALQYVGVGTKFFTYLTYLKLNKPSEFQLSATAYYSILTVVFRKEVIKSAVLYQKYLLSKDVLKLEELQQYVRIVKETSYLYFLLPLLEKFGTYKSILNYLRDSFAYLLIQQEDSKSAAELLAMEEEVAAEEVIKIIEEREDTDKVAFNREVKAVEIYLAELEESANQLIQRETLERNLRRRETEEESKFVQENNYISDTGESKVSTEDLLDNLFDGVFQQEDFVGIEQVLHKFIDECFGQLYKEDKRAINKLRNIVQQYNAIYNKEGRTGQLKAFEKWLNKTSKVENLFHDNIFKDELRDSSTRMLQLGKAAFIKVIIDNPPSFAVSLSAPEVQLARTIKVGVTIKNAEEDWGGAIKVSKLSIKVSEGFTVQTEEVIIDKYLNYAQEIEAVLHLTDQRKIPQPTKVELIVIGYIFYKEEIAILEEVLNLNLVKSTQLVELENPFNKYANKEIVETEKYLVGNMSLAGEILAKDSLFSESITEYIVGDKLSGKTSLLKHLANDFRRLDMSCFYLNLGKLATFEVEEIVAQYKRETKLEISFTYHSLKDFFGHIKGKLVLLFDNLDVIITALLDKRCEMELLTDLLSISSLDNKRVIITETNTIYKLQQEEKELFGAFEIYSMKAFDEIAIQNLFQNVRSLNISSRSDLIDMILSITGGHPYLVQLYADSVVKYSNKNGMLVLEKLDLVNIEQQLITPQKELINELFADEPEKKSMLSLLKDVAEENPNINREVALDLVDRGYLQQTDNQQFTFTSSLLKKLLDTH